MKPVFQFAGIALVVLIGGYILMTAFDSHEQVELVELPPLTEAEKQALESPFQQRTAPPELPQTAQANELKTPTQNSEGKAQNNTLPAENQNAPEPEETDTEETDITEIETVPSFYYSEEEYQFDKQQFREWQSRQKEQINDFLSERLQGGDRRLARQNIFRENKFLNEQNILRDKNDDEIWAGNMEQIISDLVVASDYSYGVEVESVTCKQFTCELFGVANDSQITSKLRQQLYAQLNQQGARTLNSGGVSYLHGRKDETVVFYYQILFDNT